MKQLPKIPILYRYKWCQVEPGWWETEDGTYDCQKTEDGQWYLTGPLVAGFFPTLTSARNYIEKWTNGVQE